MRPLACGPLAQSVEQLAFNQFVAGSIPARPNQYPASGITGHVRIITLNVNGLRAAVRKGFWTWLADQQADIVCVQEIKAQLAQLPPPPSGFHAYYHPAQRPGYAGVGLLCRIPPEHVQYGLGGSAWADIDAEGRYLEARWGTLAVVSLYLHSGSAGALRQALKFDFMRRMESHLHALRTSGRSYVLCGDWNIAHTPNDLKNWRNNQKNSGFLPEERAWLDQVFGVWGWRDAYRVLEPDASDAGYTWWSNRGQAWAKNVGWRIDYQVITPDLAPRAVMLEKRQRFSDHAPLCLDYDRDFP